MTTFKTRELNRLKNENENLREENLRLTREISALDLKLFKTYGRELEQEISDKLDLSALQRSTLAFIFSIEHARIVGVPEEKILHNKDEIDKFFMSEES